MCYVLQDSRGSSPRNKFISISGNDYVNVWGKMPHAGGRKRVEMDTKILQYLRCFQK